MSNTNIIAVLQSQLRELQKENDILKESYTMANERIIDLTVDNDFLMEDNKFLRRNNELLLKELEGA